MQKKNYHISGYITNLGKYNEGYLVGKYIDFPINEQELAEVLKEIKIDKRYEEYFFTDYDGDYPKGIRHLLGEYTPVEELNKIALALQKVDESGATEQLEAFLERGENFFAACANAVEGRGIFVDGDSYADLADWYITSIGGIQALPKRIFEDYLDYAALGRDIAIEYYADDEDMPATAGEYWCEDENATSKEIGEEFVVQIGIEGINNIQYYLDYACLGKAIYDEGEFIFTENGIVDCYDFDNSLGEDFENQFCIVDRKQRNLRIYHNKVPTLCAGAHSVYSVKNNRLHKISGYEGLLLQGFPKEYAERAKAHGISNTALLTQVGNAMTVPVVEAVCKTLLNSI